MRLMTEIMENQPITLALIDTSPTRRKLMAGIGLLFAAPALVKASSLMAVKAQRPPFITADWAFVENYSAIWLSRTIIWDRTPVIEFTQAPDAYNWKPVSSSLYNFQGIPIVFDK